MCRPLLIRLDAHRVASRAARTENRGVVRAHDEGVSACESQVLGLRSRFIDIVTVHEAEDTVLASYCGDIFEIPAYTLPLVGSAMAWKAKFE